MNRLFAHYDANYTASQMQQGIAKTYYRLRSTFIKNVESTETIDGVSSTTYTAYHPDLLHTQPIETKMTNSFGTEHISRTKYVGDLVCQTAQCPSSASMSTLDGMIAKNMIHLPLETTSLIKKLNSTEKVVSSKLISYKNFGSTNAPVYKPEGYYLLRPYTPLSGFQPVERNGSGILLTDNNYETDMLHSFDFDANGNQISSERLDDIKQLILWAYDDKVPAAIVKNANLNEVAVANFEDSQSDGWSFSGSTTSDGFGQGNAGNLSTGSVSKSGLPNGEYLLSFWQKSGGSTVTVNGAVINTFQSSNTYELKQFKVFLTGASSNTIALSGNAKIDHIRIHPSDALMQTYVYDPIRLNMVSASTENNIPTFYAYDGFDRLHAVNDFEMNLLSLHEYAYDINGYNLVRNLIGQVEGLAEGTIVSANEEDVVENVSFIDGLGRPIQEISVKSSPLRRDIVTIHDYDDNGRELQKYLPFTYLSEDGGFHANAQLKQSVTLTGGSGYGYSEQVFDGSPLNRVMMSSLAGADWRIGNGHENSYVYRSNAIGEVKYFDKYGGSKANYPENTLFVAESIDPDGHSVISYTDKLGRKIMQDQEGAKTYYVYDDFGRINFVIPPKVFAQMELYDTYESFNPLFIDGVYKYVYDNRGNVIRKDIPGKDEEKLYYDRLDRLVLSEDAEGQKLAMKYDVLSRPVMTGLYTGNQLPSANNGLYEITSGTQYGYTLQNSFPSSNFEVHTINYYDDYDFNKNGVEDTDEIYMTDTENHYNNNSLSILQGGITGTQTAFFEPGSNEVLGFKRSVSFMDARSNVIQNRALNHTGEEEIVFSEPDFRGLVMSSKRLHRSNIGGLNSTLIKEDYVYDHRGRLLEVYHQINNGTVQQISAQEYNEREMLKAKKLGVSANGQLQKIDYTYNLNGWLTGINTLKSNCSGIDQSGNIGFDNANGTGFSRGTGGNSGSGVNLPTSNDNDLFSLRFAYNNHLNGGVGTGNFNGNISQVAWQSGCGEAIKLYDFEYDNRNQLTNASYHEGTDMLNITHTGAYDMSANYDLSGNILHLDRKLNSNTIDDLTYDYGIDNQLNSLEEVADLNEGFIGNQNFASYQYDNRGNMNRDEHKNMSIIYNLQNLPILFAYDNLDSIKIQYDAGGTKLAKYVKSHTESDWTIKTYLSGIEYADNAIEAIYFTEGRAVPAKDDWAYEYGIKDHLGNTRITFSDLDGNGVIEKDQGEVLQENHYYPFGMTMKGSWQQVGGTENPYQYNGKEMNSDFGLNWLDYGARWYDPSLARWHSADPLAEEFQPWSPYNYVMNNPIMLIDPDGRAPVSCPDCPENEVLELEDDWDGTGNISLTERTTFTTHAEKNKDFGNGVTSRVILTNEHTITTTTVLDSEGNIISSLQVTEVKTTEVRETCQFGSTDCNETVYNSRSESFELGPMGALINSLKGYIPFNNDLEAGIKDFKAMDTKGDMGSEAAILGFTARNAHKEGQYTKSIRPENLQDAFRTDMVRDRYNDYVKAMSENVEETFRN
ncbi:MAG: RHS repeat-associated core domain-containing protein [Flavobacteriales bacterium]|nr:RHS repeat-associated core domain-containing protein [Flavobacteriales bacterium]